MYSGVLGVLLAFVLFGTLACGGSDQSAETVQKSSSANGFTTYTVDSQGFSIAVPDSWKTASADDVIDQNAIDKLQEKSPILGQALAEIGKPSSVVKLLAYDPNVTDSFTTNLNVVVTPLPDSVTQEQFFDANVSEIRGALGKDPDHEELDLPAGHALHLNWPLPGLQDSGAPVADQYFFFSPGRGYVLTYTVAGASADEYADTFERSARSFTHS